jgi:lipoate-protein ligase A
VSLSWEFVDTHGNTAEFHSQDPPARRTATFHSVDRPTLVLGSAQPEGRVRERVAEALGVDVLRRRSGGGGVLLLPGEFVWLDLVIPVDDPLWSDDVGRAMVWVGECWSAALATLGVSGVVHRAGLVASTWSRDVCFAGVGSGEVLAGIGPAGTGMAGRGMAGTGKLVGISQRRTRQWARFQSMVHLRWRPELVAALVEPPAPTAAALAEVTATVPCSAIAVRAALINSLTAR